MKLKLLFILLVLLLFVGCTRDVSVFESTIYSHGDDTITVDCSDEVNRNRKIHTDEGYPCEVRITEDTSLKDSQGKTIKLGGVKTNDLIQITLTRPLNISKNNRSFEAKEIRLQNR